MRGLLLLAIGAAVACGDCARSHPAPTTGRAEEAPAEAETEPVDPSSPMGRAAAYATLEAEARAAIRQRALGRAEARRRASEGDHADALQAYEGALEAGEDPVLRCEAGFEAIRLERWAVARTHLEAGLERARQPRLRSRCLTDLARIQETEGELAAARAGMREALALRPSATASRALERLESRLADARDGDDADGSDTTGSGAFERTHPSLEAFCAAASCVDAAEEWVALPAPGEALAPVRELAWRTVVNGPWRETWLLAHEAEGWRPVAAVGFAPREPEWGALDPSERPAEASLEDGALVLSVRGEVDESEGEAAAYLECEESRQDTEAARACFEVALGELSPPETWSHERVFAVRDGTLVEGARRARRETQASR